MRKNIPALVYPKAPIRKSAIALATAVIYTSVFNSSTFY